jgi:hypothetical protein
VLLIAAIVRCCAGWGSARPLLAPDPRALHLRDFFESLALMLEGGVPMLEALPAAIETVVRGEHPARVDARPAASRKGESRSPQPWKGVRTCGSPCSRSRTPGRKRNASGNADASSAIETAAIAGFYEQLAAWLPRIVYALGGDQGRAGIFSSGGVDAEGSPEV